MKTFGKLVVSFGLLAVMASPAWAQRGGFGFGGGAMLLSNKGVQEELKASDEQASKLNALAEEQRTKGQEFRQTLQDLSQEERQAKMQEFQRTTMAEIQKSLATILKPDQLKRFNQISTQTAGVQAFATPRVQEALKLTDDQKTKVREISQELMQSQRELFQGLQNASQEERQEAMKKMTEMRKSALEKALAALTADQRTAWKDLTGEPYEVKFEPRPQN